MKFTNEQTDYLKEQYDLQPYSTDSLGGTNELMSMTLAFNRRFKTAATTDLILARIIQLRKGGHLLPKTLRGSTKKEETTWSNYQDHSYKFTMTVTITAGIIEFLIAKMLELPVSRQEVYDFLKQNNQYAFPQAYWHDETDGLDAICNRAKHLFPELYQDEGEGIHQQVSRDHSSRQ